MPKSRKHQKSHRARKTKSARRRRTIRRLRGGYDPVQDNGLYPTEMKGYPVTSNWSLPDPKFSEYGPLKPV